jgi:hypothetical protein
MALQPGPLTDAIELAYETEWKAVKPNPLPAAGKDDRRLLFAGVARGVLQYLSDHHDELILTIKAKDQAGQAATFTITGTDLGITTS